MNDELAKHESKGWLDLNQRNKGLFPGLKQMHQPDFQDQDEKFKNHSYELNSMIVHHGFRSGAGHYYSVIKVQPSKERAETRWAKFDDDKITFIDDNEIDSYS